MNLAIELATVIVELVLAWYFFSGILGKSKQLLIIKLLVGFAGCIVLTSIALFVKVSVIRTTVCIVIIYFIAKTYFQIDWIEIVYPTILFFFFAIISDILCGTLLQMAGVPMNELLGAGIERFLFNISGKLVHLLCLYLFLTVSKPNFDKSNIIRSLPLLSCQVLSIYICFHSFTSITQGVKPAFVNLETVGLLYINLVICTYVDILSRAHEAEEDAQLALQQLEIQKNYYLDVMQQQEETRSLWHDIRKYIASIESLVEGEDKEEAQNCLHQIRSMFYKSTSVIDTGNTLIDSILTYGIKSAEEVGVIIQPEIWVDTNIDFPATDLFVIIGNTLDNAIEACSQVYDTDSRIVSLSLFQKNHLLLYEIKNPYNPNAELKQGRLHGYGLKNVKSCLERDKGEMFISKDNNIFTVSIQLNLANQ